MSDDPRACPTCRARVPGIAARCPECQGPLAGPSPAPAAKAPKWRRTAPAAPPPADAVPCFALIQPWNFRQNRLYWASVAAGQLVGVYVGAGPDMGHWHARPEVTADDRRTAARSANDLLAHHGDHPFDFALAADEIGGARVAPLGWWFRMNNPTLPHVGLLRLTAPRGPWLFAFPTEDDRDTAAELLGTLLADKLEVTAPGRD